MINILFSGNEKVFDGMLTCMLSIFKRTQTTEPFHFYILTMDVSHIKPEYTAVTPRQAFIWNRWQKNIIRITVLPDVMFLLYMKRNLQLPK